MPTRWITVKPYISIDHEELLRVTVFEESVNKETVKEETRDKRMLLIPNQTGYQFKGE